VAGVTDPALAAAMARNLELQSELDGFQRRWRTRGRPEPAVDRTLLGPHQRVSARAALAEDMTSSS
jgi:hypothetical protein